MLWSLVITSAEFGDLASEPKQELQSCSIGGPSRYESVVGGSYSSERARHQQSTILTATHLYGAKKRSSYKAYKDITVYVGVGIGVYSMP